MDKVNVLLDHDGSVDDFVALILTLVSPRLDLRGVFVTDGDCYLEPAIDATSAICSVLGHPATPVWGSAARAKNPFPAPWREESWRIANLPVLRRQSEAPPAPNTAMDDVLADHPSTVIATGPLTNLHLLQQRDPVAFGRIERIHWMGGAFEVVGNVREIGRDGSAEWNAYWDVEAAEAILRSGVPMTIVPLDVTRSVPIVESFLDQLNAIDNPVADLAAQLYGTVRHRHYEAWDLLTVATVCWPDLFEFEARQIEITLSGPSEGRTSHMTGSGPTHDVVIKADGPQVLDRFLESVGRCSP